MRPIILVTVGLCLHFSVYCQQLEIKTRSALTKSLLYADYLYSENADAWINFVNAQTLFVNNNGFPTMALSLESSFAYTPFHFTKNITIGDSNPFSGIRLNIVNGLDVKPGQPGYLVIGNEDGVNVSFDNNEIMARNDSATSNLVLQNNGGNLIILQNGVGAGGVGIGLNNPSHILHVNGIARSFQAEWATSSDRRVKQDIRDLDSPIDIFMKLRPVSYQWNPSYRNDGQVHYGFVAQEVEEVMPNWVGQVEEIFNGQIIEDFKVLNMSELTPVLVKVIQSLSIQLDNQQAQIAKLEKLLSDQLNN